jgi:hypothetical protein
MILISVLLVAAAIVGYYVRERQLPDSLSETVYLLPKKWQPLWTIWAWLTTFLLCVPLMEVMHDDCRFLVFITMGLLLATGVWPLVKSKKNWHFYTAFFAGLVSQCCVCLVAFRWLILWLPFFILVAKSFADMGTIDDEESEVSPMLDGRGALLSEIICIVTVAAACLTRLL